MLRKIDYKRDFRALYLPPRKPVLVKVPKMKFLMVHGKGGNPEKNKDFQNAMMALYGVVYTVKFTLKFSGVGPEYTVPPLEGLWYTTDGKPFDKKRPKAWAWTVMVTQPPHVTRSHVRDAVKTIRERAKKKKSAPSPKLDEVILESFHEGLCVQMLHLGPYDKEQAALDAMQSFAHEQGYRLHGKHHEIYLNDPRRVAPSEIKTVLRHPIIKLK